MNNLIDIGNQQHGGEDYEAFDFLLTLIPKERPIIGNLGVWTGRSTIYFAQGISKLNGKVHAIDHFQGSEDTALIGLARHGNVKEAFIKNVITAKMEDFISVADMPSEKAVNLYPDNTFDLFFIDADHRYSAVSKDIDMWLPTVKKGGIICGHDYEGAPYDERYIEQDYVNGRHHGVIKAVTERFNADQLNRKNNIWWVVKK